MDPMQQPPQQPNPYGFITDPTPPKPSILGGNSMKGRIIVVAGGAFILLILAMILITVMSSLGKAGTNQLKAVYAEQQELIRVANIGAKDALGTDTRGYATVVALSTQTSQQQILQLLQSRNVKITPEEAAAKLNSKTADILTGAAANNRYDETVRELLEERITSYNAALKAAYEDASNETDKQALSSAFDSSSVLIFKPN